MVQENHEKTSVRLAGTGIWIRDLSNASLVRYHVAISLDNAELFSSELQKRKTHYLAVFTTLKFIRTFRGILSKL